MMRLPSRMLLPVLLLSACAAACSPATNLLPGLTYYKGPEKLAGSLVFLLTHQAEEENNTETSATIYDFDLNCGLLRKVSDAPSGDQFVSDAGNLYCVISRLGTLGSTNGTIAFVYSGSARRSRTLALPGPPLDVALADSHVFFQLHDYPGHDETADRLLDFDFERNEKRWVELPGSSRHQYGGYTMPYVPAAQTNTLNFYYSRAGRRIEDGRDYETGIYSLDVQTGHISWVGQLGSERDRPNPATSDGRYVFFEGPEAPISGFRLVSSPWDHSWSPIRDPKGEKLKVLHAFRRSLTSNGGTYVLRAISPYGNFALVMLMRPRSAKSAALSGWTRTYYLVDIVSGSTRVLLTDQIEHNTTSTLSPVHWVR